MNARTEEVSVLSVSYDVLPVAKKRIGALGESNRQFLREILDAAESLMRSGGLARRQIQIYRDAHGSYDHESGKCSKTRRVSALHIGSGAGMTVYGMFVDTHTVAVYRQISGQPAAQLVTADDHGVLYDINKVVVARAATV